MAKRYNFSKYLPIVSTWDNLLGRLEWLAEELKEPTHRVTSSHSMTWFTLTLKDEGIMIKDSRKSQEIKLEGIPAYLDMEVQTTGEQWLAKGGPTKDEDGEWIDYTTLVTTTRVDRDVLVIEPATEEEVMEHFLPIFSKIKEDLRAQILSTKESAKAHVMENVAEYKDDSYLPTLKGEWVMAGVFTRDEINAIFPPKEASPPKERVERPPQRWSAGEEVANTPFGVLASLIKK